MTEENLKLLKEYQKWRRGKGRKYSQPGMPFDTKQLGIALDEAIVACKADTDLDLVALSEVVGLAKGYVRLLRSLKLAVDDDPVKSISRYVKRRLNARS